MAFSRSITKKDFYLPDQIKSVVEDKVAKYLKVFFHWGYWSEISQAINEKAGHRDYSDKIFPMICLPLSNEVTVNDTSQNNVSFSLYLITDTEKKELNSSERQTKSMKQVLMPLYNKFLEELKDNEYFRVKSYIEIPHIRKELYSIGVEDSNQNQLDIVCDAIQLTFNNISINK